MIESSEQAFFDAYLGAWNAHDSAAVAGYMAEDAIYEDVALGRVLRGPAEIASFVEEATRSSSDFRFEVVSLFMAGNDYANEWVMVGRNDREMRGVPATGRSFRVRGASVGRLDERGESPRTGTTTTSRSSSRSSVPTNHACCADRGAIRAIEIHVRMTMNAESARVLRRSAG